MRNNKSGLTMSIIFKADSANFGEGTGNVATLKKFTRGDGKQYTYISRQAIHHDIIEEMNEAKAKLILAGDSNKSAIQYAPKATIKDSSDIDLSGYMKTVKEKNSTFRSAVMRISNAISLEPYNGDMDFLTNAGLANRMRKETGDDSINNNIAQIEMHRSYYAYTISIDLDKIGIDDNDNIELDDEEKYRRVAKVLRVVKYLYRDIKARREDFEPLFVVGGVYDLKSAFFENALKLNDNLGLDLTAIKSVLTDPEIAKDTEAGLARGIFNNDDEVEKELNPETITEFFTNLTKKVADFYEVQGN